MLRLVARRAAYMVVTLFIVSVVAFLIIQLPPGDFLDAYIAKLRAQGASVDPGQIQQLQARYGLDDPFYVRYWKWISGIVADGDFGQSFEYNRPVGELIWDRLPLTVLLGIATLLVSWAIALPAGIYSAVRRYSPGDYVINGLTFVGMAVPGFLVALVAMYLSFLWFGQSAGGLFSPEYADASWNLGKVIDLLEHLWLPIAIIGLEGTAALIRVTRSNLADELQKPYVLAARSKGLPERRLLLRYPVRVSFIPFVSTLGWTLPALVSGEVVVAYVLGLPTTGPLLLGALQSQDMYLAGSIILILSFLTVAGTVISDLLLAVLDPRIRLQEVG